MSTAKIDEAELVVLLGLAGLKRRGGSRGRASSAIANALWPAPWRARYSMRDGSSQCGQHQWPGIPNLYYCSA